MDRNYQDKITFGEMIQQQVNLDTTNPQFQNLSTIMADLSVPDFKVTPEKVALGKDEMESRTGIFHWRFPGNKYKAVDRMTEEELEIAKSHCEKRMNEGYDKIEELMRQAGWEFEEVCKWFYRMEKLEAQQENGNPPEEPQPAFRAQDIRPDIVEDTEAVKETKPEKTHG